MKKIVLLLFMACVGLTMQAQIDSVSVEQVTEAERIIDKYSGKVTETVTDLVEGLKGPAEAVFSSVVKLQIAKGIGNLIPILITLLFLYLYIKEYNRITQLLNSDKPLKSMDTTSGPWDGDNITAQLIVYLVACCVMCITAMASTYGGLLHLIAPEWYAIVELVNLVK